jgi:hypothetical protein
MQNGQYVMYFGGWDTTQEAAWTASGQSPHDTIYRVVCNSPSDCPNPQPVIKPLDSGLNLINDPSIVDTGRGYYIMYRRPWRPLAQLQDSPLRIMKFTIPHRGPTMA